jgi:hypothetical protein
MVCRREEGEGGGRRKEEGGGRRIEGASQSLEQKIKDRVEYE